MNPWDKTSKSEPGRNLPAAATPPAAASPASPLPEAAEAGAQTNRLNAETIQLVAQANESRARQLRELEEVAAWLQRSLVAEAARLKQRDEQLAAREAKALDQNQAAHDLLQAEGAKAEAARGQVLAAQQEIQRLRQDAERLQARSWPAALRPDSWRAWRERLTLRAAAEPLAALFLARLHTAAALEGAARVNLEALRDLGDAVYETCPEEAEKIAQALTLAAAGRFEIKTVRIGDRIDRRFMQPSAAGLVEVRAVSGWAIRDAAGKWQFLAGVS